MWLGLSPADRSLLCEYVYLPRVELNTFFLVRRVSLCSSIDRRFLEHRTT
jgi:hypothetical protein